MKEVLLLIYIYSNVYENHDETVTTYCSSPALSWQPAAESRAISQGDLPGGCGRLILQFLGNLRRLRWRSGGSGVSHVGKKMRGRDRPDRCVWTLRNVGHTKTIGLEKKIEGCAGLEIWPRTRNIAEGRVEAPR